MRAGGADEPAVRAGAAADGAGAAASDPDEPTVRAGAAADGAGAAASDPDEPAVRAAAAADEPAVRAAAAADEPATTAAAAGGAHEVAVRPLSLGLRFGVFCVAAVVAVSVIARATGGGFGGGPTVVAVGDGQATIATGFSVVRGRVVTVAHVLEGDSITVRGGDGVARRASVVRRDDELDLALLDVPGLPVAPARRVAGTRVLVRREDRVAALSARVVRRIDARVRTAGSDRVARRPALELAAPAGAGDSGAPIVRDGRIAGVVFARSDGRPGVAYAVDASVLGRLGR